MNDKCLLVTPHNIQDELIKNEIEQINLRAESFKEQKYNEILREYKQLQNNWNELKKFVEERIKFIQEEKADFEEDLYNNYETNKAEITIRSCNLTQLEDVQERMQELEDGKNGY